jgi:hypothetical protein
MYYAFVYSDPQHLDPLSASNSTKPGAPSDDCGLMVQLLVTVEFQASISGETLLY